MRAVFVSDTHLRPLPELPGGDLLIHAGDGTMMGTPHEVRQFDEWLASLPHRHKLVIAGNHEFLFEQEPARARALLRSAVYLQDELAEIERPGRAPLRVWGSPWQPAFHGWAFNLPRGAALAARWAAIPANLDVLVTHSPPFGILDRTRRGEQVGCEELRKAVEIKQPRFHVFGHIHEAFGRRQEGPTTFVNASICDGSYRAVQPPVVCDL